MNLCRAHTLLMASALFNVRSGALGDSPRRLCSLVLLDSDVIVIFRVDYVAGRF